MHVANKHGKHEIKHRKPKESTIQRRSSHKSEELAVLGGWQMILISSTVKPRKSGRLQKRRLGDPIGVTQSGTQCDEAEIRVISPPHTLHCCHQ